MMGGLQAASANLLPPPDGPNNSMAVLQQTLREWAAANAIIVTRVKLILGFGYDQSQLKELCAIPPARTSTPCRRRCPSWPSISPATSAP